MAATDSTQLEPDARTRLLESAAQIFGAFNLEGATTRQIADHAGVNQAAIPYYFGGKEGLYVATVEYLFREKFPLVQPLVQELNAWLATGANDKTAALALLKKLLTRMLGLILDQDASLSWGRIIMREQMQPTKAFDIVYEGAVRHVHQGVTRLLAVVLGRRPEERAVIFRAHMLVGHVLIFLAGRETIRRRAGLTGYTKEEIAEIQAALAEQLDLLVPEFAKDLGETSARLRRAQSSRSVESLSRGASSGKTVDKRSDSKAPQTGG
jgi:TetR/AcrR family transcriptional regulator, regulator of cefoperazone and chloramphenicol sensitivity